MSTGSRTIGDLKVGNIVYSTRWVGKHDGVKDELLLMKQYRIKDFEKGPDPDHKRIWLQTIPEGYEHVVTLPINEFDNTSWTAIISPTSFQSYFVDEHEMLEDTQTRTIAFLTEMRKWVDNQYNTFLGIFAEYTKTKQR